MANPCIRWVCPLSGSLDVGRARSFGADERLALIAPRVTRRFVADAPVGSYSCVTPFDSCVPWNNHRRSLRAWGPRAGAPPSAAARHQVLSSCSSFPWSTAQRPADLQEWICEASLPGHRTVVTRASPTRPGDRNNGLRRGRSRYRFRGRGLDAGVRTGRCPSIDVLETYQPRQTSKLYAADGRFIAEIGLERRTLLKLTRSPSRCATRSSSPRTSASTRTTGSIGPESSARASRNMLARGYRAGVLDDHDAARAEPLSRDDHSREDARPKAARGEGRRARSRPDIRRTASSSCISIRSIWATARSASRRPRSSTSANRCAISTSRKPRHSLRSPKDRERYNPRRYPERAVTRRNTVIELMRRAGAITRRRSEPGARLPARSSPRKAGPAAAARLRPISWSGSGSSSMRSSGGSCTSRASRSTRRSIPTCRAPPSGRWTAAARDRGRQVRQVPARDIRAVRRARRRVGEQGDTPSSPYLQGCFVAMDPRTGAVRALVGGRDFDDSKFDRATQALRQPGSTFKPIVYADAIQNGRPPSYMVDDFADVEVPQPDRHRTGPRRTTT